MYFYCVIGVAACIGFLNTPGKAWLKNKLRQRNAGMAHNDVKKMKKDSDDFPALGMPEDPVKGLKETVNDLNDARKIIMAHQNGS